MFFPYRPQCTVTLNSNFAILKKTEIVFNWNKRIISAYSFVKKKKKKKKKKKRRRDFALFKCIFLRNRSFSNAGWFYGKKRKIEKGNLYLTENRFSRNKIWCAVVNHNHMHHIIMCKKIFRFELLLGQLLTKYQCFTKLPQISHTHKKLLSLKYNWTFLDQLLLP